MAQAGPTKNLNILSLDGGGPRGISQLMILKNVMESLSHGSRVDSGDVEKRPCEVFHLIGGVGTGGLIAIFLVVLKMTATEALEEFTSLVNDVFKNVAIDPKKRTEKLKRVIERILEVRGLEKGLELIRARGSPSTCKLIVPIMCKNHVGVPCVLRNYIAGHEPPTNLTIAEAMLATCATPPFFTSTSIEKDFTTFEYIGGDFGLSNPTREIIGEAHRAFGDDTTVACLLSIGCGQSGINTTPSDSGMAIWMNFLNHITADSEKTAREMASKMEHLTLYHRLCVNHGLHEDQVNAWGDPVVIATHTTAYLGDLEVVERVNGCADAINHEDGFTTLEQLRHSGGAKVDPPALPPLTPHYVERKEATSFVEKSLFEKHGVIKQGSKIVVVTGIGGCGKTQLIRKFIKQHGHRFSTVFFADGSSRETFQRDLVRCVRSLGTAHSQKSFDESMVFLSQPINGERLLVIDNVDDPTMDLAPLLPRWSNGTAIITSRSSSRGQLGHSHLELDVMSLDESVELLVRGSRREWPPSEADKETAIAIAKELGCHPIALVQAISYMLNTGHSVATYITRLRSHRQPVLNNFATNQVDMRYQSAFAAFDASYEILPPNAQKALHLLSLFHWQNFCLDLVSIAAEDDFSTNEYNYLPHGEDFERGRECLASIFCSSGQWNPLELDSLRTSLLNHSLVTVVSTGTITLLQMHPLVHEWARSRGPSDKVQNFREAAIRLLCCGANKDNHYMMQYLSPHVQALSSAWDSLHVNDALSFAFILHQSGFYRDAARLRAAPYELLKARLGASHLHAIEASAALADTYCELGRYDEAEELEKQVLRRGMRLLGEDHPYTIMASGNLAHIYCRQGRYSEAEELEKEVLRRRNTLLGADHPDTITASANLAATYYSLGRYGEAEKLQKEVLLQSKRVLGMDHPHTTTASGNLAVTYRRLGRYSKAEELQKELLQRRKTLLGEDHPDTISAFANLAGTYYALGRYTEAEALQRDLLKQQTSILGNRHPDSVLAMYNLAYTCNAMGRRSEAVELARNATQILSETQGEKYPLYLKSSAFLADLVRPKLSDQILAFLGKLFT